MEKPGEKPVVFERNAAGDSSKQTWPLGITPMGIVFTIDKHADGSQERVHENGTREEIDAKGNLLVREGHDQKDRLLRSLTEQVKRILTRLQSP